MIEVFFPEQVEDEKIRYAVIVAKAGGKWLFARHRARTTLECPGGHREAGETPRQAACRELWEETGATGYELTKIGPYGVKKTGTDDAAVESFGMLYRAEVFTLGSLPEGSEITETVLLDALPQHWTYPDIQPYLLKKAWPECFASPTPESERETCMKKTVSAYVMDKQDLVFRDEDAALLNQLNFSFAHVRDGRVTGEHWLSIEAYKAYIAKYPHILPVLSVGGWGADGFSQAAATEASRSRFVESAVALMQTHGFLGLDMDWEYPCSAAAGIAASPDDRQNFSLLMQALRKGLDRLTAQDGRPRLLACALGASPSLVDNIDCTFIGQVADQVNLMTYDMYTPGICCHHTALYTSRKDLPVCGDTAVRLYTKAGIPAEKIMLGCAMYGRMYLRLENTPEPLYGESSSGGSETIPFRAMHNDPAYRFCFDAEAKAAYALSDRYFISCDTPESIACKRQYGQENRLMGLMCWEYSSDADGLLLSAMNGGSAGA